MDKGIYGTKYVRDNDFKNFFQRNKQFIITGKTNILNSIRKHQEIKKSNMREYWIRNLITETNKTILMQLKYWTN